ncbi:MAG TPA: outer membrane beta-barrel protein [Candidatus Polarisedimenticolia bacterium]|nr:outer membrane beta-barrel protein [Candidatus Polarisedimenticolia bacterium]
MQPAWRRYGIIPMLLVAGTILGGSPSLARDSDGAWEFGGYAFTAKYDNSSKIDNTPGFGVRGAYHFKAERELEIDYDRGTGDTTDTNLPGVTYDVTKYTVNYLRNFIVKGSEKMVPFLSFGAGKIRVDRSDLSESVDRTLLRVGGGFKYFFSPRIAFRLDLKGYRWRGDPPVTPAPSFFSFDATVGVAVLVGGGK